MKTQSLTMYGVAAGETFKPEMNCSYTVPGETSKTDHYLLFL